MSGQVRVFEYEGRAGQLAATGLFGEASKALNQKFPAREVPDTWPATASSAGQVLDRLSRPPLKAGPQVHWRRTHGTRILLGWLASLPGDTWQQRWHASGASSLGKRWAEEPLAWRAGNAPGLRAERITEGLNALILADVLRPGMDWLTVVTASRHWRRLFAVHRDPDGFARLAAVAGPDVVRVQAGHRALNQVGVILAAKGGMVSDITVGDCLELREAERRTRSEGAHSRSLFYDLLRELGNFPPDAPPTLRHWNRMAGQVSVAQLVDRYALACRPVRDLIVAYLTERQPAMDYTTLEGLSRILAFHFWKTLETLSPGIGSLLLAPDVAAAWKQRIKVKVTQRRQPDGTVLEVTSPRANAFDLLTSVRSFYLDIAQWALEEPARWGPWAARCPVSAAEGSHRKNDRQRKARMDQRTRERLPSVAALSRLADQRRAEALARFGAVRAAEPGQPFTVLGETMVKVRGARQDPEGRGLAFDGQGARRNLILEEHRAFWTWAAVEFFRGTGCRIEEMMEVSHHSVTQYAVPHSGEVIPLLQIAPSKTDTERLLVVDAELADVLATIISRIRGADGTVPLVSAWDVQEKVWNPPLPLLFQWTVAGHKRGVSQTIIRKGLNELLQASGLADAAGQPLRLSPHDFRRIFATEAILSGMPPHIAQLILGHQDINTTMGYKAIYPQETINGHRAFIARRRAARPSEEYRTPTDEEWAEFLGHFERRKVALGDCGRAYGTSCPHEHSCVRCPVLRVDPGQRPRLAAIRDNLTARIAEAEREGWLGEAEGLRVSLAAARDKLAQLDERIRRAATVSLGTPAYRDIAARTATLPAERS